ncbi:MAG: DUF177 domain-containing protein [Bacteroidaceae bacterium]|nr:DUF177 domain-containing protein [Bacteroidaceae bacterium]
MDTSGRFQLDIRDLDGDEMSRCWQLDDSFFSALDEEDIKHGELTATLRVKKKAASYQLDIHATGTIEIPCDRCLEPMTQPIEADDTIEVRLGDTFEDDGERITLPEDQPVLDVSWNLYETIALAIPTFHAHPDGECPEDVSQYLVSDDEPGRDDSEGGSSGTEEPTDSRWDALKALLDK